MIIETETGIVQYSDKLTTDQLRTMLLRDTWTIHNRSEPPAKVEQMLQRLFSLEIRPRKAILFQVKHAGKLRIKT